MATLLTNQEIQAQLANLPEWMLVDDTIQAKYTFKNFVEAISFVNRLVEPAETAGHHPDIAISYNQVTISLSTHDAGGLTAKDFAMADTINRLNP
jgi:4a-hydroxytetrahydrobiopterin dehydratase